MNSLATLFTSFIAVISSLFGINTVSTTTIITAPTTSTPVVETVRDLKPTTYNPVEPTQTSNPNPTPSPKAKLDLKALPLGDGKISTEPKVGYLYSCSTSFRTGGADHAGGWIHGDTWSLPEKISVEGNVSWPQATFSNIVSGLKRLITGNGLPVDEPTGNFPISSSDPAFQFDRNPNAIKEQGISYSLPANPSFAAEPSCVPMGAIGVALDGVAIYNALDDAGRDAVAHEVQDSCDGHPQSIGQYHYHGPSPCMPHVNDKDTVVGYALDGFPITSLYDQDGNLYTNDDLDICHGKTSSIVVDGKMTNVYHYVLTQEYPYTLGCFRGTPLHTAQPAGGVNMPPNNRPIPRR